MQKTYTFYSKSSGLEIAVATATKGKKIEGRVRLRLFPLEEGGRERQIVLMLNPLEAFALSRKVVRAVEKEEGLQKVLIHRSERDGVESTAYLNVDVWERAGKKGFGFTAGRENGEKKRRVSIALNEDAMLFAAELLRRYAVDTAYEEKVEAEEVPF